MNYDVSRETVCFGEEAFDGRQEVPVDVDFNLPDYCPDVQRILKCHIRPGINSRNISGDRLNVDGIVNIKLIYMDAERASVRCCESSSPFSCSIDLKSAPENAAVITSSKIEYVNCRAVSPRKVDVHGALAICAKVYNKSIASVTSSVDGEDVQQKLSNVTASDLAGIGQQHFTIGETLDLGRGKPAPEIIIRSDVSIYPEGYKNMVNKVVVKGEAIVKILYMSDRDSGDLEVMEYSIPVSQVVDVPGANESSSCVVKLEVLNHEEQIQNESSGDSNLISTEIKAAATVMAYDERELGVVTDVYSTERDLRHTAELVKICKLEDSVRDDFSDKSTIEFTEYKISRIIDIWSDDSSVQCKYEDGFLRFDGKTNVCILAIDLEEVPFYIERTIDVSYKKDFGGLGGEITADCRVYPTSLGYRITGSGSIEIKADLKLCADVYSIEKLNMVTEAFAEDCKPASKDSDAALTIYYADEGESLWDIARKYYTSVDAIKRENEGACDVIDRAGMLLIPIK